MKKNLKIFVVASVSFFAGFSLSRFINKKEINYGGDIIINSHNDGPADVFLAVKDSSILEKNDAVYLKIKKSKVA